MRLSRFPLSAGSRILMTVDLGARMETSMCKCCKHCSTRAGAALNPVASLPPGLSFPEPRFAANRGGTVVEIVVPELPICLLRSHCTLTTTGLTCGPTRINSRANTRPN